MLNYLLNKVALITGVKNTKRLTRLAGAGKTAVCAMAVLAVVTGCQTTTQHPAAQPHSATPKAAAPPQATNAPAPAAAVTDATNNASTNSSKSLVLQEGDTIKITFPGAPNLDTIEAIRRDGKITLQMIGEYDAAGKTPAAMEADLKRLYGPQLVNNDVSVTVQSSAFVVYCMGAVGRPGKIISDRPLTVLQALIEAGADDTRSNLKSVKVLRTDESTGKTEQFKLNIYKAIHDKNGQMPPFTLKPYDTIFVPERFNFF